MTPEAQRIAIAEACGWKHFHKSSSNLFGWQTDAKEGQPQHVPDYLGDLNAMHEAEKSAILKDVKLYLKFVTELEMVVGGNIDALFATAAQRAEAFLRTLGLWKE